MGVLSALMLILWGFRPVVLFVHFCFSLSGHVKAWRECWLSTPVSCDHGIVHLDCWSLKIFSHFWGFCPPWSDPLLLSSCGAFVHFCFSLSGHVMAWRECWLSTPVSCDHGIVHLDCWSLKYFLSFGGFVRLDADPLGLSSCGAFVHFCFSLSIHVMAWRECWLSTPVSCDHGIVHLDCWSLKIFSQFWRFCPPWCWSFGAFVLWCFCIFLLFSVRPCDIMTRMLIVHTCIMWSWDRTPWLLEP